MQGQLRLLVYLVFLFFFIYYFFFGGLVIVCMLVALLVLFGGLVGNLFLFVVQTGSVFVMATVLTHCFFVFLDNPQDMVCC